jgi:hypothetical protein
MRRRRRPRSEDRSTRDPDPDRRRELIAELWTEDGAHILPPPQEKREIAARRSLPRTAQWKASGSSSCSSARTAASGATTSSSRVEHGVARVKDSRGLSRPMECHEEERRGGPQSAGFPLSACVLHRQRAAGTRRVHQIEYARARESTTDTPRRAGLQETRDRGCPAVPANTSSSMVRRGSAVRVRQRA